MCGLQKKSKRFKELLIYLTIFPQSKEVTWDHTSLMQLPGESEESAAT